MDGAFSHILHVACQEVDQILQVEDRQSGDMVIDKRQVIVFPLAHSLRYGDRALDYVMLDEVMRAVCSPSGRC